VGLLIQGPTSAPIVRDRVPPLHDEINRISGPLVVDDFVSLVRNVDGKPSAEKRCERGLTCDYTGSVPDGAGVCKRP